MQHFSIVLVGQPEDHLNLTARTLLRLWGCRSGIGLINRNLVTDEHVSPSAVEITLFKSVAPSENGPIDLLVVTDWSQYRLLEDQLLVTHDTIIFCNQINQIPSHLLMRCGFIHEVPGFQLLDQKEAKDALPVFMLGLLGRILGCTRTNLDTLNKLTSDITRIPHWATAVGLAFDVILPAYLDGMVEGLLPSKATSVLERHPLFSALHQTDETEMTADVNNSSSSRVPSRHASAYNGEHSGGLLPVH